MGLWLNGDPIPMDRFPNGERHWKVDTRWVLDHYDGREFITISWQWQSDADVLDLLTFCRWIQRKGFEAPYVLEIAYLPYSRMDRAPVDQVFSLSLFTSFLSEVFTGPILLLDLHSDVSAGMLPNATSYYPIKDFWPVLTKAITFRDTQDWETVVVFPDAGAEKRYAALFDERILVGVKHRDPADGKISYRGFLGEVPEGPWQAVITDDLCSFGNTFLQTAKALRAAGAQAVYLYVTHAEPAMLQGDLFSSQLINRVFTTDTMGMTRQEHNDALYVWPLWAERLAELAGSRQESEDNA